VPDVGSVVRRGIFRGAASRKRMEKAIAKRRIPRISQRVIDPLL